MLDIRRGLGICCGMRWGVVAKGGLRISMGSWSLNEMHMKVSLRGKMHYVVCETLPSSTGFGQLMGMVPR